MPTLSPSSHIERPPDRRSCTEPATAEITPAALLAEPDTSRRWLAAQDPTAQVGLPESLFTCPIATFLRDSGVQDPVVATRVVRWDWVGLTDAREAPLYVLPAWAGRFVLLVDQVGSRAGITARRALALLDEAQGARH